MSTPKKATPTTQYMSFNTPIEAPAANQCGSVTFTDVHVASGDTSHPDIAFPMGCQATTTMTAPELALEFMFFDLSSCVTIQTGTQMLPPIPPPGSAPTPPAAAVPPPPPPPPPPPIVIDRP